jgi:hypothetical protein
MFSLDEKTAEYSQYPISFAAGIELLREKGLHLQADDFEDIYFDVINGHDAPIWLTNHPTYGMALLAGGQGTFIAWMEDSDTPYHSFRKEREEKTNNLKQWVIDKTKDKSWFNGPHD